MAKLAPMKVSEQFASDVIVTAIEAGHTYGIGYWARTLEYHNNPEPAWARIEEYDEVTGKGLKQAKLDRDAIQRGIDSLATRKVEVNKQTLGCILAAVASDDTTDIDGPTADVIVQAAVLGDIVYG